MSWAVLPCGVYRTIDVYKRQANNSLEPRAATLVTGALADELQRDGTYRLSTGADADIRVEGEVYSITCLLYTSRKQGPPKVRCLSAPHTRRVT